MDIIECLAEGLENAQTVLGLLTDNLPEAKYAHVPCNGANNTRWIMDHLAQTDRSILARLGAAVPSEELSFKEVRAKLIEAVRAMDPADLDRNVDGHPLARTLGSLLNVTALHTMLHAGQISTIRRSLGYPPVLHHPARARTLEAGFGP